MDKYKIGGMVYFLIHLKRTIVVDQIETYKQLVLNGIGYALLPSTVLKEVQENMYKTPVQLTRETWLLTSESARQLEASTSIFRNYRRNSNGKIGLLSCYSPYRLVE